MKRIALFVLPLVVCACGSVEIPDVEEETPVVSQETKKFTFTIKGDFANPTFVEGDGEAETLRVGVVYEPTDEWGDSNRMSRANQYMTADGVELAEMWVVDVKDGEIQQSLHQVNTDSDWGAPTMNLTLGTHHVMFLASRGTGAQYNEGVVTWTKAHDTFYTDYEVTVVKTSNGNRAVTLDRCVTKLMLTIDDAIPVGTTSLAFVPGTWYSGWNMLTGEPVAAPAGYNVTFSLPQSYGGATGTAYAVYSLSGKDEWTTDVTVTSKAGETVNASVTLTDVPLKANRASVYHGAMYSNSAASSVSLNAEWLTQYEGVY